jgi:hypothetical protein
MVSTVKKSYATIALACARRHFRYVLDKRRGTGLTSACCRIAQIGLAAIRMPSLASSHWISTSFAASYRQRNAASPRNVKHLVEAHLSEAMVDAIEP